MGVVEQQKKKGKGDGDGEGQHAAKKEETPTTVILKVDMHCNRCASKFIRCLRGVESLKTEREIGKLTITGIVDPSKLSDKLAHNMKNNNNNNSHNLNKPKQPPVTTVVLKVGLHCQGCIERIRKTVLKTKGVHDMAIDKEKETVTVKGTMDVKVLVGNLKDRLKRKVEVVPPKKEKDSNKEGAEDKGAKGGAKKKKGGEGGGGGGDNEKDGKGGGDGDGKAKGKTEQSRMELLPPAMPYGYGYCYDYGYDYGAVYMGQPHAPQLFSDENPNACSVM